MRLIRLVELAVARIAWLGLLFARKVALIARRVVGGPRGFQAQIFQLERRTAHFQHGVVFAQRRSFTRLRAGTEIRIYDRDRGQFCFHIFEMKLVVFLAPADIICATLKNNILVNRIAVFILFIGFCEFFNLFPRKCCSA